MHTCRKDFQFYIYDGQTPNTQDTHSDGSVVLVDDLVHVKGLSADLCVLGGSLDGGHEDPVNEKKSVKKFQPLKRSTHRERLMCSSVAM